MFYILCFSYTKYNRIKILGIYSSCAAYKSAAQEYIESEKYKEFWNVPSNKVVFTVYRGELDKEISILDNFFEKGKWREY